MRTFYLKEGDTRPILAPPLRNPAAVPGGPDTAYDLTGADSVTCHITLSDGTKISKTMAFPADRTTGIPTYAWLATDWDPGGLVASPALPLADGVVDHRMEYEVLGPAAGQRLTFPNNDYDTLHIEADLE